MLEMASKVLVNEKTKAETQRFTWKLPYFSEAVTSEEHIALQHVSYQVGESIGIPINLTCALKKGTECVSRLRGMEPCLGFSVKLTEPFPPAEVVSKVRVRCALQILSNSGDSFYDNKYSEDLGNLLQGSTIDFQNVFHWNFPNILIPPNLLQGEDDTLSVYLTATIINLDAKPVTQLSSVVATFKEKFREKMTQDLKTLYQEPGPWRDAPTKVVCRDATHFHVNRGILCTRSPVFRTMFQTEMSEADSGQVKIDEIPSRALDVFLHFVHTGELKDNWKEVGILEGLTYAAHKYELHDLFEFLKLALDHLVNQENCGRLLNLAKTYGMEQAEKQLMEYFKREVTSMDQAARIMREAESVLDLYPQESETGNE